MTEFSLADPSALDPSEFIALIRKASDRELATLMSGQHRRTVLDAIFKKMGQMFRPDQAGATKAVIHWNITGGQNGGTDTYQVAIADQRCTVTGTPDQSPQLTVSLSPVDFLKLLSGKGNPMMMLMMGKIKTKGDLGLASSLVKLFDFPKG